MSSLAAVREGYERFDPRAYLHNNYLPPRADFSSEEFVVPWKLRCLAETFASGEGETEAGGGETEARGAGGARRHPPTSLLRSPLPGWDPLGCPRVPHQRLGRPVCVFPNAR